ncbi:MAG: hypothetical protein ACODAD_02485 [Planctomycetota bacterium]
MRSAMACAGAPRTRTAAASLTAATLVSLGLSSLAAYLCLIFAGAGEAAVSPGLTYFAPLWAYPELVRMSSLAYSRYINWATAFMFVYYCIYGVGIGIARLKGRGGIGLLVVLVFHYTALVICLTSSSWDGLRNIWMISRMYGPWICVALVEYFVFLHLLAVQYAFSEMPYRPRVTRNALMVLAAGLVAGIGLHLIAMMQAPEDMTVNFAAMFAGAL